MTMPGERRFIFHIGFPRCGSTLLQREIFPRLQGDFRAITPACADRRLIDFLIERFIFSGRNIYLSPVTASEREEVGRIVSEYRESTILISCEGLVGDVFENMLTVPHLLQAVRDLFGQVEILLVIRRQTDLLRSYYRHALEEGYYRPFAHFVGFSLGGFRGFRLGRFRGFNVDPAALNFNNFVNFLEHEFGADNVHVLPFEWIKADFQKFSGALAKLTDTQLLMSSNAPRVVNAGLRDGDVILLRALNRIWDSRILGLPLLPKLNLLSQYEQARQGRGAVRRICLGVASRFSPMGALRILRIGIGPVLNVFGRLFGWRDPSFEREIEEKIESKVFESNAILNEKLGGMLTGLGYCDRR